LAHQLHQGHEKLISLTEKSINKSLNPILFTYKEEELPSQTSYVNKTNQFLNFSSDVGYKTAYGDFNGDGDLDIIFPDFNYNFKLYTDINSNATINSNNSHILVNSIYTGKIFPVKSIDNGLTKISNNDFLCNESFEMPSGIILKHIYNVLSINTTNQFVLEYTKEFVYPTQNDSFVNYKTISGDFDGNGISDIILFPRKTVDVANPNYSFLKKIFFLNLDRRITSNYVKELSLLYECRKFDKSYITSGDVNGDGKTDIIVFEGAPINNVTVYSLNENSEIYQLFSKSVVIDNQDYWKESIFSGDFNGDGKTDFFIGGPKNTQGIIINGNVLISTVNSFNVESISPDGLPLNFLIPVDKNNDGKTELISMISEPNFIWFRTLKRNGINNWSLTTEILPNSVNDFSQFKVIAYKFNKTDNIGELSVQGLNGITYFRFPNNVPKQILLTKISNNNVVKKIEYKNLVSGNGIYSNDDTNINHPNYSSKNIITANVVSKIEEDVFGGLYRKQLFKYHGLVYNTEGLGSLGFQSTMRTNWFVNDSEAISHITKNDITKRGAPIESFSVLGLSSPTVVLTPTDPFISKTYITYNFEDTAYVNPLLPNKVFKLFKSKVQNFNGLNNTSSVVSTTYNTTNNPTQTVETIKNGTTTEQISTTNLGYDSLVSPYMVDRVISKNNTTSIFTNADTTTSEKLFSYDKNLLKEIKKKGHNTVYVTEKNDFDVYGNIIKKTLVAPGLVDRVSNFEYDTSGRFLIKAINVEGLITAYTYDLNKGLMLTETQPSIDGFPLRTTYIYMILGEKILKQLII
jgi:hypothetical protein